MKNTLVAAFEQANPVVGDIAGNARRMLEARRAYPDCDLVVFPECFLTGYPLEDLALRAGFIGAVMSEIETLRVTMRAERGPALLFGAPVSGADLPHNAGVLIRADGTVSMTVKTELPNNDVFDEVRTFRPGDGQVRPLTLDGFRLGVLICEDMWHGRAARQLSGELADMLLVLNGSPFEAGKQDIRRLHARRRVAETGLPLVYLNQVGGQDEVVFDGASFAFDRFGHEIAQMPFGTESSFRLGFRREPQGQISMDWVNPGQPEAISPPHTPYPSGEALLYGACVLGLGDYVRKIGNPKVVLGVSGGLDSALVAAMAVDALGADRVTGVMLPSRHTGDESLSLADALMDRLGIRRLVLPIGDAVAEAEGFVAAGAPASEGHKGVALENIQSRLRGLALMALANTEGSMVLSTGNKSEMSVGYATLYGDMNGGFNPLKDLYKSQVFALARWRNKASLVPGKEARCAEKVIPERIISRPPTAELADAQSDEAALGSYDVLDALLKGLIEDHLDTEAARQQAEAATGKTIDTDYAMKISGLLRRAEFKRRQAAPGIKLTNRSFGKGWRYPIAGTITFANGSHPQ